MRRTLTKLPKPAKTLILVLVDASLAIGAIWGAMFARAGGIPRIAPEHALMASFFAACLVPTIALFAGLYKPVVRFHIPRLSLRVAMVAIVCALSLAVVAAIGGAPIGRGAALGLVFGLLLFAAIILSRNAARWLLSGRGKKESINVAVYGAGEAGRQLVALLQASQDMQPVLFIDDDPSLQGRIVEGLPVVGSTEPTFASVLASRKVDEILLAIPSLTPSGRRTILERLSSLTYRVRTVPGLAALLRGDPKALTDLRDISVEELLGRDPVPPLPGLLEKCVKDRVVLVTGGGGSIGSELCRQVLTLQPSQVIVLDHSELALYTVEQELQKVAAAANVRVGLHFVLGSVCDEYRLNAIFEEFSVDTIYHAAAYKHVPIVEKNPLEGIRTNVLGTFRIAKAAAEHGAKHFVLISSDKAVRPTNVMGATKRMAELVVQLFADRYPTTIFSMVRFGNVLGSSGSVVPLFREQIKRGGPVTLTHPDVTRYFMTIQEAVELVIQAGAMAEGGEVFVLDMGQPVRIKDLAERMIRLSGRTVRDSRNPHGDVAIEVVGLRQGEKLFEELLISGEATPTEHARIWKVREKGANEQLARDIESLASNPFGIEPTELFSRWVERYDRNRSPANHLPRLHVVSHKADVLAPQ